MIFKDQGERLFWMQLVVAMESCAQGPNETQKVTERADRIVLALRHRDSENRHPYRQAGS